MNRLQEMTPGQLGRKAERLCDLIAKTQREQAHAIEVELHDDARFYTKRMTKLNQELTDVLNELVSMNSMS